MVRGLYIIRIEDNLAEVDVRDLCLHAEGCVPPVEAFVDDSTVDIKFYGVFGASWAKGSPDPETGNEEDDVVGAERLLEFVVSQARGLFGIIDVVLIVRKSVPPYGDIDLD